MSTRREASSVPRGTDALRRESETAALPEAREAKLHGDQSEADRTTARTAVAPGRLPSTVPLGGRYLVSRSHESRADGGRRAPAPAPSSADESRTAPLRAASRRRGIRCTHWVAGGQRASPGPPPASLSG